MNHDKDKDDTWNAISRIEVSVKNSQDDIRKLYLHSVRQEVAVESNQPSSAPMAVIW
ncbi:MULTISPECIES: hypothetical protein [unclassified Endozoicomonas]|uniref:hypothetical protein n=1 Tax=unclassified Endozoicomonas TaxID=2644528 RepID=UPI00214964DE|nr:MULTISPECIES: hypothetical protein [unclassified Endozoicomonas]